MMNNSGVLVDERIARSALSRSHWVAALACLLVAGCGGDGGNTGGSAAPPPPTTTPAPAPSPTSTISVSVTGLRDGQQLALLNNGSDQLNISGNGTFSFAQPVSVTGNYAVTVSTAPTAETCTLSGATGTVQTTANAAISLVCGPTTLHSFTGPDGSTNSNVHTLSPNLTLSSDGNIYGSISGGGTYGFGTLFRMTPKGDLTVLHHFADSPNDGKNPEAALIEGPGGDLYGTSVGGGSAGLGTIFKISQSGVFTIVHSFTGGANDGAYSKAALVQDGGSFYGTTGFGGVYDRGTVFKIDSTGNVTVLYSFQSTDGDVPNAPLTLGSDGNFYGTTSGGGTNSGGTVFKITLSGTMTSLHSFGGLEGTYLYGPIVRDKDGNVYGTTYSGDPNNIAIAGGNIFKLSAGGQYSVVHQFVGPDGAAPVGGLTLGPNGNIYGTTSRGGGTARTTGTIFQITPSGTFTSIHVFKGGAEGEVPRTPLIYTPSGILYGATSGGGTSNLGTIFRF